MRIAFVAANRERMPDPVIPLGLLSVMASCGDEHDKRLLDLCFEPDPEDTLGRFLEQLRPDLVAISLRNLQNNDYTDTRTNLTYYRRIVDRARECCGAPIVLGGGAFSVLPEGLLGELGADYGIAGEGEVAFPDLLRALSGDLDFSAVGGLYRRAGSAIVGPSKAPSFADLTRLPPVDRGLVDARYYEISGIDSLQTKRGCPMPCAHCTYPQIEGRAHRLRPASQVADELERIRHAEAGANHVFFVDAAFNLPPAHALEVCATIAARGIELPWTCYVNPTTFGDKLAHAMAAAGCVGMELGVDSGCDHVLARLRKGFTTSAVREVREVARRAGIKDCQTYMLGTPGESLDDVKRTLGFIDDVDPFAAILMVWKDDAEAVDPGRAKGREGFRQQILEYLDREKGHHPRWVIPSLRHHFLERSFRRLRRAGFQGPLWQHLHQA